MKTYSVHTQKLLAEYLASCLTDGKLAAGYKKLTGKDMLKDDENGFDFMVQGNQLFHKYCKLAKKYTNPTKL